MLRELAIDLHNDNVEPMCHMLKSNSHLTSLDLRCAVDLKCMLKVVGLGKVFKLFFLAKDLTVENMCKFFDCIASQNFLLSLSLKCRTVRVASRDELKAIATMLGSNQKLTNFVYKGLNRSASTPNLTDREAKLMRKAVRRNLALLQIDVDMLEMPQETLRKVFARNKVRFL